MQQEQIPKDFYVNLGQSGLKVSKLKLGCLSFGKKTSSSGWYLEDEDEIFQIMKTAYDLGIRTFDTLDCYSAGASEEWIGKFLRKFEIPRESIVIMTKCYNWVHPDFGKLRLEGKVGPFEPGIVNEMGLSRKHIFDAVELSVKRLGTYIDVLQIHRYDETTSAEEIMRSLNDVIQSGKVRYIGASSMWVYQFIELQNIADKHGWHKFISMQNYYNLIYREEEREMIPYCNKTGVGIMPWSPLAGGILARPYDQRHATIRGKTQGESLFDQASNIKVLQRVEELSHKYDVSMAVISMAWLLSKKCYPIIGITKIERIYDLMKCLDIELTKQDIEYLEENYEPNKIKGLS